MVKTEKVEVAQEEIEKAQALWGGFTNLMKYSVIAIAIILILMAIFLL